MKKKAIVTLTSIGCCLVVALAAVLSCVVFFNAGNNVELRTEPDAAPVAIADGKKLYDGDVCAMPQKLTFASANDNTTLNATATASTVSTGAVTLTATITPSDATNKNVSWEIAWKNPSSTWASGKTVSNYVKLNVNTSNRLQATITNVAPFGEQILITCTSAANTSAKATCTVDYVKRVTGVNVVLGDGRTLGNFSLQGRQLSDPYKAITIASTSVNYGVGTVEDVVSVDWTTTLPYLQTDTDLLFFIKSLYGDGSSTMPDFFKAMVANDKIDIINKKSNTFYLYSLDYSWEFLEIIMTNASTSVSACTLGEIVAFEEKINKNHTITGMYIVFTVNSSKLGTYTVKSPVVFTQNSNYSADIDVTGITLNNYGITY